jgi:hypothetical protein
MAEKLRKLGNERAVLLNKRGAAGQARSQVAEQSRRQRVELVSDW